jgi:hypothetical protein
MGMFVSPAIRIKGTPPQYRIPPNELNEPTKKLPQPWTVCRTHQSFYVAHKLTNVSLDYYLPIVTRKVQHGRDDRIRYRNQPFPLFPGWIFLYGDASWQWAWDQRMRPQTLHAKYQLAFHNDLRRIAATLAEESQRKAKVGNPRGIKVKDTVRVTAGSTQGTMGRVEKLDEVKGRVEIILGNASYEVELPDVERVL